MCKITEHISVHDVIDWFTENVKDDRIKIHFLEECDHNDISNYTKIFMVVILNLNLEILENYLYNLCTTICSSTAIRSASTSHSSFASIS